MPRRTFVFVALGAAIAAAIAPLLTSTSRDADFPRRVAQRLAPHRPGEIAARVLMHAWGPAEISRDWRHTMSAAVATWRSPRLDLSGRHYAIEVTLAPDASRHRPLLLWSFGPSFTGADLARNRLPLPGTGDDRLVTVRADRLREDRNADVEHFYLHADVADITAIIEHIAIVDASGIARGPAPPRVTLNGESRDVVSNAVRGMSYEVNGGADAVLTFAVGFDHFVESDFALRVTQSTARGDEVVLDAPLQHHGWKDFRAPLRPGRSTVTITSTAPPSIAGMYWTPAILLERDDRAGPPNVLLYVIDALRADALGAYGASSGATPFLDALASRSLVFEHAYSAASWTKPSITTLLTSLYPQTHRLGARYYAEALPASTPTLQRMLADAGYVTAQFIANPFSGAASDLDRAFDMSLMPRAAATAPPDGSASTFATTAATLHQRFTAWLEPRRRDRFFAYLHVVDTHPPFAPATDRSSPRAAYESALRALDREVAALYASMERLDLASDTLIVITADHGASFGEHGIAGHGQSVYEAETRVPLIVHWPRRVDPGRVSEPVHAVDVTPTIRELLALPADARLQGRTLLSRGGRVNPRPSPIVVTRFTYPDDIDRPAQERTEWQALVDFPWKVIARAEASGERTIAIYRLDEDPQERVNLVSSEPARARQLTAALDSFLRDQARERSRYVSQHRIDESGARRAPSPELREQLRSLGYVR